MPMLEYIARSENQACEHCRTGFEIFRKMSEGRLEQCPQCGAPVHRRYTPPSIGGSKSGFDQRAKEGGFHKFQRLGRGEYERKY